MSSKEEILAICFETIGKEFKKTLMKDDIKSNCSIKDCRIIEYLYSGPKTMSELSCEMQLTPGTMTSIIDKLIETKYVKRVYDKNDRRKVSIVLLKKGDDLANILKKKHNEISNRILYCLEEEEQNQLIKLISKICNKL